MRSFFFICLLLSIEIKAQTASEIPLPLPRQPKNIVLLIGDGMGINQVYAGMVANGNILQLERFYHLGLSKTYSSDNLVTDSGAGATALSIGRKTFNGAIGVGPDSSLYETILESAQKAGKSTGLVATCDITHATPASFAAHQPNRDWNEAIAEDIANAKVDLLIGGGIKHFEARKDQKNLLAAMEDRGVQVVRTEEALFNVKSLPVAALLWDEDAPAKHKGRNDILPLSTLWALERLSTNEKGFFLMVEGSQIDWGGHANDADYITAEMIDFDKAIGFALDFAERNKETLIIVTADHETGGFAINGGKPNENTFKAAFTTKKHTAAMVPVFAFGPGAENFTGIMDNTQLYEKMMQVLSLQASRMPVRWENRADF